MIEIPPVFAGSPPVNPEARKEMAGGGWHGKGTQGLAEDVFHYGQWMRHEAEKRVGRFYPKIEVTGEMVKGRRDLRPCIGKKLTVIAWLWARTVKSPNPAFARVDVPLATTFLLSTRAGREAYVEPVIEDDDYRFTVKMGRPKNADAAKSGTKLARGANFKCLMSGTPIAADYIKAEGKRGRMGARLMAIVAEADSGRVYLPPTPEHEAAARKAKPEWKPEVTIAGTTQYLGVKPYGMERFDQIFTDRQLVTLTTFSNLVGEARERMVGDAAAAGLPDDGKPLREGGTGTTAYADGLIPYLAFVLSKTTDYNCALVPWYTKEDRPGHLFSAYRHPDGKAGAEAFFLHGMTQAMQRLAEQAHPAFPVTIYYAFKQVESDGADGIASTGWETFLEAVIRAGFGISGTWPMRTERNARSRGIGSNALASSIVLVCRRRAANAPTATRRAFVTALRVELPPALDHLQRGNIAPVDLAQAAIGPGMAIYTRYSKVLDAEGKPLPVREALALINETLAEALAEQEGDFDADSRWALTWFEQAGFAEGEYGVAEQLSKSKNTSVGGMVGAGILESKRGKVRLLKPEELPRRLGPDDRCSPHGLGDRPPLDPRAKDYQQENWLLDPNSYWVKIGRAAWDDLERLADPVEPLWINGHSTYNGLYEIGERFLTVSLGEPHNAACYKLIAAIIEKGVGARA